MPVPASDSRPVSLAIVQPMIVQMRILWSLVAVRIGIALIFMLNILPLGLRYKWYLHHGGDQDIMFRLAVSIIRGQPSLEVVGIGQPLMMIPWILILKPYNFLDMAAPMVVINGFTLGGLSVLLLGLMVWYVTRNKWAAWLSAALWAVAPLIAYFSFFWHFDPEIVRSSVVPKIGWLNGLSDPPPAFLMLLAVMLLARWLHDSEAPSWRHMLVVGISIGLAVTFRPHLIPMALFLLGYVLLVYGWRSLAVASVGALIGYLPQAWYNLIMFKSPLAIGYIARYDALEKRPLSVIINSLPFQPANLLVLADRYIGGRPWLLVPVLLGGALAALVAITLWRRSGWKAVALLVIAPLSYLGPMALSWPFRDDVIRFSLPVIPFAISIIVYGGVILAGRLIPSVDIEIVTDAHGD